MSKANLTKWIILSILSYFLYLQVEWLIYLLIALFLIQIIANISVLSIPSLYNRYMSLWMLRLKKRPKEHAIKFLSTDWIGYSILLLGVLMSGSIYLLLIYSVHSCIVEVIVKPTTLKAYNG